MLPVRCARSPRAGCGASAEEELCRYLRKELSQEDERSETRTMFVQLDGGFAVEVRRPLLVVVLLRLHGQERGREL